jgi:hypothetical protein
MCGVTRIDHAPVDNLSRLVKFEVLAHIEARRHMHLHANRSIAPRARDVCFACDAARSFLGHAGERYASDAGNEYGFSVLVVD